jgi:hypothetical protein
MFKDTNICWCLFVPSQEGWKPSPKGLKRPGKWPDMLKEIIPWFGIPVSLGSAFVDEVVQLMAKALAIAWKLHTAYCPQSSGKVDYMNRTLKSVWKTVSGDPSAVGSITAHSITKD